MKSDYVKEFKYTQDDFNRIKKIIYNQSGITLNGKEEMVYSRLIRRLRYLGFSCFGEYCDYVEQNCNDERAQCVNAITTNVTAFFREKHHFDFLKDVVLPRLLEKKTTRNIYIWSAGCSYGQEAYSIAMTIHDQLYEQGCSYEVFATDLNTAALAIAKKAVYSIEDIECCDESRYKKWIIKGERQNAGLIRISPALVKNIVFNSDNLMIEREVYTQFDVVFCRNVIIYFDKKTKIKLLKKFYECIKPGGYLILGYAEILDLKSMYKLVGRNIYQKIC